MIPTRNLLALVVMMAGSNVAQAQQTFPRPIVLYRPPANMAPQVRPTTTATFNTYSNPAMGPNSNRGPAAGVNPASNNGSAVSGWNAFPAATVPPANGQPFGMAMNAATIPNPGPMNFGSNQYTGSFQNAGFTQNGQQFQGSNPGQTNDGRSDATPKTPEQELAAQQNLPTNQMMQNPSGAYNMTHTGITNAQQFGPNTYFGQQFQDWSNQRGMQASPASFGEMSRFPPNSTGAYVAPNTYMGTGFSNWNNLSSGGTSPNFSGGWSYSVWP